MLMIRETLEVVSGSARMWIQAVGGVGADAGSAMASKVVSSSPSASAASSSSAPALSVTTAWIRLLIGLALSSSLGYALIKWWMQRAIRARLSSVRRVKRDQQIKQTQLALQFLGDLATQEPGESWIIRSSASSIEERLVQQHAASASSSSSSSSSLDVPPLSATLLLKAFLRQTILIHQKTNACSEMFFDRAIRDAEELDARTRSTGQLKGSLHGLPVSLKDSVNIKGVDSSLGVMRYCSDPAQDDALVVKLLREAGAIVFVKSNVPQTMISFECSNPVFGPASHLLNQSFTCGGSSGGESLLVAGGGSAMGIGTDIGGSVRIPAHFCGLYALKPTSKRLTLRGFRPAVPGQEAIPGVVGPIGISVNDVVMLMRAMICPTAWREDPELVPLPLNEEEIASTKPLRIGYYVDDGVVRPSPACARAVEESVQALRQAGHTVVPFQPPNFLRGIELYLSLIAADGGYTISNQLIDEVWEPYVSRLIGMLRMPAALKHTIAAVLRHLLHDEAAARCFAATRPHSTTETWRLQAQRKAFKDEFLRAWATTPVPSAATTMTSSTRSTPIVGVDYGFDVLITPVHALPAVKHNDYSKITFTAASTFIYNLIDLPAGVVPVTHVRLTDVYTTAPRNLFDKMTRKCYDAKASSGFPVGVQIVGKPYADETVLRAMRALEKALAPSVVAQRTLVE